MTDLTPLTIAAREAIAYRERVAEAEEGQVDAGTLAPRDLHVESREPKETSK